MKVSLPTADELIELAEDSLRELRLKYPQAPLNELRLTSHEWLILRAVLTPLLAELSERIGTALDKLDDRARYYGRGETPPREDY